MMSILTYHRRAFYLCISLLAMLGTILITSGPAQAQRMTPQRVAIAGQQVPLLAGATPQAPMAPAQILHLAITLNLRDAHGLDSLIAAQKDPTSPQYHHYLTPAQFAAQFAPSSATVDTVTSYLRGQGLTVDSVAPNNLIIYVSGSVALIQQAFAVNLAHYTLQQRAVYGPTGTPTIPANLSGMIMGISGLDDVLQPHRLGQATANDTPGYGGGGPAGGYTPAQFRTAYNINPLITYGNSGSGKTIAFFEASNYDANDIVNYRLHYGLPQTSITNVFVNVTSQQETASGAVENDLDLDAVSDVAPNAALRVYMGPSDADNTVPNFIAIWQRMITDDAAQVISTSWGDCEAHFSSGAISTLSSLFKQAVAQGQSIFAASGDAGPFDCQFQDRSISVDYPASDPNVIGVGGTTLFTDTSGNYQNEVVWSCATCGDGPKGERPYGLASGGGFSSLFPKPSYQAGPGIDPGGWRQVPDVAADADGATGYSVYCTSSDAGCFGWMVVGGTSGSAPLWAAIAADLDEYLATLGTPAPIVDSAFIYYLYNSPQAFAPYHDVVSGNNLYYNAQRGYDLATGVGTPNVWNIARDAASWTYLKTVSQQTSPNPVSIATLNGTLYAVWTGSGNNLICLMHSTDGGKTFDSSTRYISPEKSALPPALVAYNNTLYIAWIGVGNGTLNVMHSTDGGNSFNSGTKYTSPETSTNGPAMTVFNNTLYIAWSGTGNNTLNLMHSTDGGNTFNSGTKYTSPETTPTAPSLIGTSQNLYIAWTGTGNPLISLMHSTDDGNSFNSSTKSISPDTSGNSVSLASRNDVVYMAWTGYGNGILNYMHSTDGNNSFDESTKAILFTETSPATNHILFNGNSFFMTWIGTGNNLICLLTRQITS